jgi:hypothetical protein
VQPTMRPRDERTGTVLPEHNWLLLGTTSAGTRVSTMEAWGIG